MAFTVIVQPCVGPGPSSGCSWSPRAPESYVGSRWEVWRVPEAQKEGISGREARKQREQKAGKRRDNLGSTQHSHLVAV